MEQPKTPKPQSSGHVRRATVLMIVLSLAFFCLTSPKAVPSVILIVGFAMLGALLWGLLQLFMTISGLGARLGGPYRKAIVLIGVALPLLLLTLQSIGQLTIRDFLTLFGVCVLGAFYVSRLRHSRAA